jgi:hypothetical protein
MHVVRLRGLALALAPALLFDCRAYDREAYARLVDVPTDSFDATIDTPRPTDAMDVSDVRDDVVPDTPPVDGPGECDPIRVPERPPGLSDVDGGGRVLVFGLRRLNVGTESRALWGRHGFDRDGLCTDPTRPDAGGIPCRPRLGGGPVEDGERGRDNAFGARLGIAFAAAGWTDAQATEAIVRGSYTIGLRISNLGGPEDGQVTVEWLPLIRGHRAGDESMPPAFDGHDVWHINSTTAYDPGTPGMAIIRDDLAFVSGGMLVAALPSRSPLRFASDRGNLRLTLTGTRIAGPMQFDGSSLGPLEFSALWPLSDARGDLIVANICPPPPADRERSWTFVNNALESAADLLSNGMNEPAIACDSISVGFGTDWVPIQLGADEAGPPVNDNPCD